MTTQPQSEATEPGSSGSTEPAARAGAGVGPARLSEQLAKYLQDVPLAPLWAAVRNRLERNGLQVTGTVQVDLDETGADRLGGLLGRRVAGPARVRLADLDAALRRSAAAAGLVSVTEALTGPLVDRRAARAARADARANLTATLDAALAAAGLGDQAWVPRFIEGVRAAGLLTRAGDAAFTAIAHAGAVLSVLADTGALTASGSPGDGPHGGLGNVLDGGPGAGAATTTTGWGLAALATRCTGDAHGLDAGRVAPALVLRAAAAALDLRPPESASEVRDLWTRLGVAPDEVSGSVIVWGLRPTGDDPWSLMMRSRADLGLPTHLTSFELRGPAAGAQWAPAGSTVSVCENPQVLQAAARAGVSGALVCTSGNPATSGWLLLRGLVAQRVRVRYHGDFDWPGMAIAGRVLAAGAEPWRLGAGDYLVAAAARPAGSVDAGGVLPLVGKPVETPWDPDLSAAMARTGVAVHEEAIVDVLLADL